MEWFKVLSELTSYGATGIITLVFVVDKIMHSDKQLKLIEQITARMEDISTSLNTVKQDICGIDNAVKASALQTLEVLYDEKMLSNTNFFHYSDALNLKHIYKALLQVMSDIDDNGFDKVGRFNMLKENIVSVLHKAKDDFKRDVLEMSYDGDRLREFEAGFELIFADFILELRDEMLQGIAYDDIKDDKNYAVFKSKIKNRIWGFSRNISGLLKNVSNNS